MKTLNYILLGLVGLMTSLLGGVQTGSEAPAFSIKDSMGVERSLSDYSGQYVVLEWTRHNCPFVLKFYDNGHMQALQKEMADAGVVWLQIASSAAGKTGYLTPDEINEMRQITGTHSTATLLDTDGTVGRAYGARTTPHMFVINPEGLVIYQGAIDSIPSAREADIAKATNYVKAAYESAVAGEPIETSTTSAYGCGVKY